MCFRLARADGKRRNALSLCVFCSCLGPEAHARLSHLLESQSQSSVVEVAEATAAAVASLAAVAGAVVAVVVVVVIGVIVLVVVAAVVVVSSE